MNFLDHIFANLDRSRTRQVIGEVIGGESTTLVEGNGLLSLTRKARAFLRAAGLKKGDRCALLAHNSIHWVAVDLALMAEGIIVVPLYARQAPAELVAIMKDCSPAFLCCGDEALRDAVLKDWPGKLPSALLSEMVGFEGAADSIPDRPEPLAAGDPATLIYTSGTSGVAKGVILTVGNISHMVPCTNARLDALMGAQAEPEQVFHYLPFCFAGSWILLLTCLSRHSVLTLSTDLSRLVDELKLAAPQFFLNVPALLERVRRGVEEQLSQRGGVALRLFRRGRAAWLRRRAGRASALDRVWLALANAFVFPTIRRKLGRNLRALICGSAPLAEETQLFFMMLGLPVLQVYGLTETTAICTMDHPGRVEPGRVGYAIPGTEMKLGEDDEILVRGPHIFPGYWNQPEETARVLREGWFHSGDQGEVSPAGNWRIIGRLKNLIIPSSGHNVPPEPIEEMLLRHLPEAQQVMLVGNGRSFLAALVTGAVSRTQVEAALAAVNPQLPHYKRVHAFSVLEEPFSIENGLLTANGKLKRGAILSHYAARIEELYRQQQA
jgi:long-chain acyl-CoA synthetase